MADHELDRFLQQLDPSRTVVLLGAGAARSSGAPISAELCRYLEEKLADREFISDDLSELASILETRKTRRVLIDHLMARLGGLQPDGALVALAAYQWASIYTTNYDLLVERAYEKAHRPLAVVRSHFDWENAHSPGLTILFKIHGCLTQDRSLGHQASMILTIDDYDSTMQYRQLLFKRLTVELAGNTVCIFRPFPSRSGHHSASYRMLCNFNAALVRQGKNLLFLHDFDPERAAIWRRRGIYSVIQADINTFANTLAALKRHVEMTHTEAPGEIPLPHRLQACTVDIRQPQGDANPRLLFTGAPASYADIQQGLTFERDKERDVRTPHGLATIILGVAGTGKTTLARRLALQYVGLGWLGYEHRATLPLEPALWIDHERRLRQAEARAILLIDNCPPLQRQVNNLIDSLPTPSALHLIVTAETSVWKVRQKVDVCFQSRRR